MSLDERIAKFPRRQSKAISYRETGAGQALVLLHGIGSSSAGWLCQLESLAGYRLIAWDAPVVYLIARNACAGRQPESQPSGCPLQVARRPQRRRH